MSSTFVPTFLYIKRHKITGLLYFGKTIRNPEKYKGSGKYWLRHCAAHGTEHIETLWYCLFVDLDTLQEFALAFSRQQSIAVDEGWANLIDENGTNGAPVGHAGAVFSPESLQTMSEKSKQSWAINRDRIVNAQRAAANTPERLAQYSKNSKLYWENADEERREQQRAIVRSLDNSKFLALSKQAKTEEHKRKIAKALTGRQRTPEHVRAQRIAHSKHKGKFRDHNGVVYEQAIDFLDAYELYTSFLDTLDSPVKHESARRKLGIEKSTLTKRELGMDFI